VTSFGKKHFHANGDIETDTVLNSEKYFENTYLICDII
jgi:hypothetical protein